MTYHSATTFANPEKMAECLTFTIYCHYPSLLLNFACWKQTMHIVIVESPAKCKTIQKYLGPDYSVLASFGHIRDLPSRDGSVRPDEDFAMDYEIDTDSERHVKAIVSAVKKANSLILATDPDREGEAISWHVLEALKQKNALKKDLRIQRVSFNSITKQAVEEAIAHPRDLDMNLVNAQQARRALDYLVGFKISPVLWRKLPGSRSAGRVQSVALRLICEREQEIEAFRSQEYWDIKADFLSHEKKDFTATLTHLSGEKLEKFALPNEGEAKKVAETLEIKKYKVIKVEKKQSQRNPYAPFTTSTLQQEASRKLGFSATRTMQTAQKLYEGVSLGDEAVGLITYMRTDAVSVVPEAVSAARNLIEKRFGKEYLPEKPRMYQSKIKNAQEAHEAIRPTDPLRTPEQVKKYLADDQFKLYELIWKRLIASQMANVILDQVAADVESTDGYARLRATGSTVRFDGFYKVYHEDKDDEPEDEENKILPPLQENTYAEFVAVHPEQHFTQPPPRYSEASLVKRLEELGIGRPSTYASIISVLQDREYVRLEKKRFFPETRGRVVNAFLSSFFKRYVQYDFTAKLEDELDEIADGHLDWKQALRDFWQDFARNVIEAMNLEFTEVVDKLNEILEPFLFPGDGPIEERRKCPSCDNGQLGIKVGKFGAFLGCSNYPECNYTRQLSDNTSAEDEGTSGKNFQQFETKNLGPDPTTGRDITLRKGPYGFYIQLGEEIGKGKKAVKPKRASLPKNIRPEDVTLEKALSVLSLPRDVGLHPETGKMIKAGIGRFGPYIQHDQKYVSLKGDDDVLTIGINRAVDLIASAGDKKKKSSATPLKILGKHPESGEQVAVYEGRYGPYIKHQKTNATLPKGKNPEDVTLAEALELMEKKIKKTKG